MLLNNERMFGTVAGMRYEVDVTMPKGLDDRTWRFLDAVQRSANRLVRFRGDDGSITLTVDVAGMCREEAVGRSQGGCQRLPK